MGEPDLEISDRSDERDSWTDTCDGCGRIIKRDEKRLDGIESCCRGGCNPQLCHDCVIWAYHQMDEFALPPIPEGKKRFYTILIATSINGWQEFYVDAKSLEEAKKLFEETGGDFYDEEVEVQGLEDINLKNISENP